MSAPNLLGQTFSQLREMAQQLKLGGFGRMTKAELAETLSQRFSPAPTQRANGSESSYEAIAEPSTHVVFLPRDPQWAYVFWEISSADRARAQAAGASQLCLRVADVTGLPLGATHPHTLQEVVVNSGSKEWYLPVPLSDRDYRVELGYRSRKGWLSLAVSSVARVPALEPCNTVADRFVAFSLEGPLDAVAPAMVQGGVDHERFYRMAHGGSRLRRLGSEVLHEQGAEHAAGLNDSGAGLWASGRNESGSGLLRQRSFWLVADAELIVYGATEPTASLFIGEEPIPLEADGTFRVHVPFRDGEPLYPIRAVAADGEQERSIRLEFNRRTPEARVNTREEAVAEWF